MQPQPHRLLGKTITALNIASDKLALRFILNDNTTVVARCDADCCSDTWIEHVELPARGFPATVLAVTDLDLDDKTLDTDAEYIQFYGLKLSTTSGDIVIDYRNSSNGYYGGSLVWPEDAEHYYGGVFGQARSNEEWQEIINV